jgi:hypothetical protein
MNSFKLLTQISISGIPVINLNLPNGGGIFANGLLSLVGTVLSVVFSLLLLVWVSYSLYAGYMIIRSQGAAEGIEKGAGIIKNIWISISVLVIFFVILAFSGSFFGFGNVYDWSQNLAQCGPNGPFYFQQVEQQREYYTAHGATTKDATVYCCPFDADNETSDKLGSVTFRKGNDWVVYVVNNIQNTGFQPAIDKTKCQTQTYTLSE